MTVGDELPGIDKVDGLRRMMNKPALFEKILRDFHSRLHDSPPGVFPILLTRPS